MFIYQGHISFKFLLFTNCSSIPGFHSPAAIFQMHFLQMFPFLDRWLIGQISSWRLPDTRFLTLFQPTSSLPGTFLHCGKKYESPTLARSNKVIVKILWHSCRHRARMAEAKAVNGEEEQVHIRKYKGKFEIISFLFQVLCKMLNCLINNAMFIHHLKT